VRKAGEYDVFVEFTTNAMLVSKPGLLDLILDNVQRVNVSFDGATPATYERLRGGSKFDKVCANIKLLTAGRKARGKTTPEFNLRYILMKDTIDELPLMVDLAKDLGVDHLFTNHLQVFMDELADQSLVHHKARTNAALARTRARAQERGLVVVLPDDFVLDAPAGARPATATALLEPPSTGIDAHTSSLGPADEGTGETWAASGAVSRSLRRPDALPSSAYAGHCPYIYDQAFGNLNLGVASAAGFVLMLIILVLSLINIKYFYLKAEKEALHA
jgi:MoaA/NifB/PqqE/SkfB family radical SAM enzyme